MDKAAKILSLCFRHFPQFKSDCGELLRKGVITVENRRLVWNFDKTSLGKYFLDQKGPAATKVRGGFWAPVESCFLIRSNDGVEAIKRGSLRHVAHDNGRELMKPSRDYEKLIGILKPYRENQARHVFETIKTIVAETDVQNSASVEKSVEKIKKIVYKSSPESGIKVKEYQRK
jgi:hypothetical protein